MTNSRGNVSHLAGLLLVYICIAVGDPKLCSLPLKLSCTIELRISPFDSLWLFPYLPVTKHSGNILHGHFHLFTNMLS
jgi:hypothetical protein